MQVVNEGTLARAGQPAEQTDGTAHRKLRGRWAFLVGTLHYFLELRRLPRPGTAEVSSWVTVLRW